MISIVQKCVTTLCLLGVLPAEMDSTVATNNRSVRGTSNKEKLSTSSMISNFTYYINTLAARLQVVVISNSMMIPLYRLDCE